MLKHLFLCQGALFLFGIQSVVSQCGVNDTSCTLNCTNTSPCDDNDVIECPSNENCEECIINCGYYGCDYTTIYSHYCQNTIINCMGDNGADYATIYAPSNLGNLTLNVISGTKCFRENDVYTGSNRARANSNNNNNFTINDMTGYVLLNCNNSIESETKTDVTQINDECKRSRFHATFALNLEYHCSHGAKCDQNTFYCPNNEYIVKEEWSSLDNEYQSYDHFINREKTACLIDCGDSNGQDKACDTTSIYSTYNSSLTWICDNDNAAGCVDSIVYCQNSTNENNNYYTQNFDYNCAWTYTADNRWVCSGYCSNTWNQTHNDPTNNPSMMATINPTINPATIEDTLSPTKDPTNYPTNYPTYDTTNDPSNDPTIYPTIYPSANPTAVATTNGGIDYSSTLPSNSKNRSNNSNSGSNVLTTRAITTSVNNSTNAIIAPTKVTITTMTATTKTTTTTTGGSVSGSSSSNSSITNSDSFVVWLIIGIVVIVCICILIILFLAWIICRQSRIHASKIDQMSLKIEELTVIAGNNNSNNNNNNNNNNKKKKNSKNKKDNNEHDGMIDPGHSLAYGGDDDDDDDADNGDGEGNVDQLEAEGAPSKKNSYDDNDNNKDGQKVASPDGGGRPMETNGKVSNISDYHVTDGNNINNDDNNINNNNDMTEMELINMANSIINKENNNNNNNNNKKNKKHTNDDNYDDNDINIDTTDKGLNIIINDNNKNNNKNHQKNKQNKYEKINDETPNVSPNGPSMENLFDFDTTPNSSSQHNNNNKSGNFGQALNDVNAGLHMMEDEIIQEMNSPQGDD